MKITIHWGRVLGLAIAILFGCVAIICFKLFNESNQFHDQDVGHCDMHEAQKIIDNLVCSYFFKI